MHYGPYVSLTKFSKKNEFKENIWLQSFSKISGVLKTMEPIKGRKYQANLKQMLLSQSRTNMSEKDVHLLMKMYRCDKKKIKSGKNWPQ